MLSEKKDFGFRIFKPCTFEFKKTVVKIFFQNFIPS